MKCRDLSDREVSEARVRLNAMPMYVPGGQWRDMVQFRFNLDPGAVGESLFVIRSYGIGAAVYRGTYQDRIIVNMDDRLARDQRDDILQFKLLRIEEKKICTWISDEGRPYWRPGAEIDIEFLWQPGVDENGLPKSFNVTIR